MAPAVFGLHVLTGAAVLLLTFSLFALNWMGGGDAKLIAATALWFGPSALLADYVLLAAMLGGLLIGLAEALSDERDIGPEELREARWFTLRELRDPEANGFALPRRDSIARRLIEDWMSHVSS